jgi:hypothetical protein
MYNGKNNNLVVVINGKALQFQSSYKVKEFFENENNRREINGLNDEMLNILLKPHLFNRILKSVRGEDQQFLLKNKTKAKYNIQNFNIARL